MIIITSNWITAKTEARRKGYVPKYINCVLRIFQTTNIYISNISHEILIAIINTIVYHALFPSIKSSLFASDIIKYL